MRLNLATAVQPLLSAGVLAHAVNLHQRDDNATLPVYRNASYCVDTRVEDLVQRMTLEEKAGQLFVNMLFQGENGEFDQGNDDPSDSIRNSTEFMINDQLLTHFNLVGSIESIESAITFLNRAQQLALDTRLGIPITFSTDPRHHFTGNIGTGARAGVLSEWPEALGLAAIRDTHLVRMFAEIAREEYVAMGFRAALHPQVDIATEPRWARVGGTWGEDAELTSAMLVEYIKGFQGESGQLGPYSVTTVTKHFPGAGPAENGEDAHFYYGKNQTYPGDNFDHHLIPFKAAIAAGARQMMPYYARPIGTKYDPVGFAFNKGIITDLLREELGFDGIVLTDWGLITDTYIRGQEMPARAWGVEHLSELERVAKIFDAGCDQFGGESRPELVVEAVETGLVAEERLDVSVRRVLKEKFLLGLFEKPFADVEAAERVVGNDYFRRLGNEAQRRSFTLLTNKEDILPLNLNQLAGSAQFYVEGFEKSELEKYGIQIVDNAEDADYALLRMGAPFEPRLGGFEAGYHAGSLSFNGTEQARQAEIFKAAPTIVDIALDRPAVVPEIFELANAVFGSYGASNAAFLDVLFGIARPEGKLPFDLPRSLEQVETQMEDVAYDFGDPIFKFGDGLEYGKRCIGGGLCPS